MKENRKDRRKRVFVNTNKYVNDNDTIKEFSEEDNHNIIVNNNFAISKIKHEIDYNKQINPTSKVNKTTSELLRLNNELVSLNSRCLEELYNLRNMVRNASKPCSGKCECVK